MRQSSDGLALYLLWVVSMTGFAFVLMTFYLLGM
jgi:hypothetical protein